MILCPIVNDIMRNNKYEEFVYNGIIAFFVGMVITYTLVIKPLLVDNKIFGKGVANMMDEYYSNKNAMKVVGIDIVFILLYLSVAYLAYQKIGNLIPIKYSSIKFLVFLLLTVIILDLLIGFLINIIPYKSNTLDFFRRWGNTAGFKSIIYDCVLLTIIYISLLLIMKYKLNTKMHFITLLVIVLVYFFST